MSAAGVLFYCPCSAKLSLSKPPPPDPPLSNYQHHPLSTLLFCEECDAIRCDNCVSCEISCYYCPNCLFEVPSASVRGEKNRCARNCFQCPQCCHTLSVVASDPDSTIPLASAAANVGQPPFYLSCSFCLWDSKKVGIKFDKPTGLALQLQKGEDSSPEILEFDHLKEHLEPFLRRGQALQPSTSNPHVTASSSTLPSSLLKDNPSLATRYGSLFGLTSRSRAGEGRGAKDDLEVYRALENIAKATGVADKGKGIDRDSDSVLQMMEMKDIEEVASLDKRWMLSWQPPILASELKPLRTPLQAKRSKRCPTCKHILIKPEQKSSSTRFKIKLVASNYLPSIEVFRRPPPSIGSRLSAIGAGTASGMRRTPRTAIGRSSNDSGIGTSADEEPLRPGRTYTFELSFTNPLYEPIHVRLAVARPTPKSTASSSIPADGSTPAPSPLPYAVNIPSPSFPISAYAEEWEYDDEDDEMQVGRDAIPEEADDDVGGGGSGSSPFKKKKSKHGPGIIERKMNRTTVAMEVAVGKDAVGPIRASMLVTYMYQSDEGSVPPSPTKSPKKGGMERDDVKSFSFWTMFQLGTVVPRPNPDSRRSIQYVSSSSS